MHPIMTQAFRRMARFPLTAAALALLTLPQLAHAAPAPEVDHQATRKICQVTGEVDRSTGRATVNRTESRYRFWGTDLGASFEHDGKLVVLFGDTHPMPGLERLPDRDLLAISADTNPEDCLHVDVLTDGDGGYRPLAIPGVDGGEFSVPTGGFSAGGAMHVVATTGKSATSPMARSILAKSVDGGRTFQPEYELSSRHFINVAAAHAEPADASGLPAGAGDGILLWGSGAYRKSDAYLAVLPADRVGDRSAMRFFAGTDEAGQPRWSAREEDSRPLFQQSCIGELSVAWNADLGKWVMMYNCGEPRSRILVRTADRPWGPWSSPQVLFDAAADKGFCRFMNNPGEAGCPAVSDPHNPETAGDPYAPYMIARFSRGEPGRYSDVYFLMSTWNPYNVVLMSARLKVPEPNA
ncbi:MAG: DUF4185 domain-containing protein [Solirubrobacterales bacterium]